MGHLNTFSASGGGNLNKNFAKNTNARGLPEGGMLKLRFDWYISTSTAINGVRLAHHISFASMVTYFLLYVSKKNH